MAKYIIIDVESDGPIPGTDQYSMVSFGAVVLTKNGILPETFFGRVRPISKKWNPESLAISGVSREEHLTFDDPATTMKLFREWVDAIPYGTPIFISDNPGFDWQWMNFYFHKFLGENPFGYSCQRIGDKFHGFTNNPFYKWKIHAITKPDHNPVNDAMANAECLLYLERNGLKLF